MGATHKLAAILRDASLREAPQDEVSDTLTAPQDEVKNTIAAS